MLRGTGRSTIRLVPHMKHCTFGAARSMPAGYLFLHNRYFSYAVFFVLNSFVLPGMLSDGLHAQQDDSVRVYYLDPVDVTAARATIPLGEFPMQKDRLGAVLESAGLSIVRKGVFFAQDIYAAGMKRAEIPIIIDGERYHSACPMRMDAPISRVNPLEIAALSLQTVPADLQAGLGGIVSVTRSRPSGDLRVQAHATQLAGANDATDLALMTDYAGQRLSLRYARGAPYESGGGRDFASLYNYRANTPFLFAEAGYAGGAGDWEFAASWMYSEDIVFPYLLMDERYSRVSHASVAWRGVKLYVNHTDHMMNNDLRVSGMHMQSDTRNITVGLRAPDMELYYRYWNADNRLVGPAATLENNMLPAIGLLAGAWQYTHAFSSWTLSGRMGFAWYGTGNEDALDLPRELYPSAEATRVFPTGAVHLSHRLPLASSVIWSNTIGVAGEAPEAEALYVNVRRFAGKPYWSGNPTLSQPLRSSLRSVFILDDFSLEGSAAWIAGYVAPVGRAIDGQRYQTFDNINALLLHAALRYRNEWVDTRIAWTWGENTANGAALAEIIPLRIRTRLRSPLWLKQRVYVTHTYENAQYRIDATVLETPGAAWNRIDIGVGGAWRHLGYSLEVENVLNHEYARHLSYVRDPFSSGYRVVEPGRTLRLGLRWVYDGK